MDFTLERGWWTRTMAKNTKWKKNAVRGATTNTGVEVYNKIHHKEQLKEDPETLHYVWSHLNQLQFLSHINNHKRGSRENDTFPLISRKPKVPAPLVLSEQCSPATHHPCTNQGTSRERSKTPCTQRREVQKYRDVLCWQRLEPRHLNGTAKEIPRYIQTILLQSCRPPEQSLEDQFLFYKGRDDIIFCFTFCLIIAG